jgi:hypothetical protein
VTLPPGSDAVADVGDENVMVMMPSFPTSAGFTASVQAMHCPPLY